MAHEVGHQWWGASVGANSNDHSFMVEGLTNYLTAVYVEDAQGPDAARHQLMVQIAVPYEQALDAYGDGVADRPATVQDTGPPRGSLDYGKSALGFLAIREAIGDHAFFAALHDYARRFAFRIATPDDLRTAFEATSGQSLGDLWGFWFESATTTRSDVDRVVGASG